MANNFFNTAFSFSMLPERYSSGYSEEFVREISPEKAAELLQTGEYENVANPRHENTLMALTQILGVDVKSGAKGGRITVSPGDEVLVAQLCGPLPRETREFTDEEIAMANFRFFRVLV